MLPVRRDQAGASLRLASQGEGAAGHLLPPVPLCLRQGALRGEPRNPCVDCGEGDPVVLEFDHLRDKRFSIGQELVRRSWRSILAEIEKCEVVCANCHRRRTARRRGSMRAVLTELELEERAADKRATGLEPAL